MIGEAFIFLSFDIAYSAMTDNLSPELVRARVSISQRIVPVASFALTAIGGMLGAWWMLQLFRRLRTDDKVTVKILLGELGAIGQSVGLIYVLAVFVGLVAIIVAFMRSDEDEATLPGIAYLAGFPCLISPGLTAYAMYMAIAVFHIPGKVDFTKAGAQIAEVIVASLFAGIPALIILLPLAFLPFTARVGKRSSPQICIGLVLVGIVILTAVSFWLVGYSLEPTIPITG